MEVPNKAKRRELLYRLRRIKEVNPLSIVVILKSPHTITIEIECAEGIGAIKSALVAYFKQELDKCE